MSIDMSEFFEVFFEEAGELLGEMESLLLKIDPAAPDVEELNAIFRAAHSIKGGAGTFGFTDMTEVTHALESLLDRIRKSELALTSDMVDAFLKAGDVVKAQLAGHRGQGRADPAHAEAIRAVIAALAADEPANTADASKNATPSPVIPAGEVAANPAKDKQGVATTAVSYLIEFSLPGSVRENNSLLDNVRVDLQGKGRLEVLRNPGSEDENPACFTWRVTTDVAEEDLWEALAFVIDPQNVKVEREIETQSKVTAVQPMRQETEPDPGYGFFEPLYNALVTPAEGAQAAVKPEEASGEPAAASATNEKATDPKSPGGHLARTPVEKPASGSTAKPSAAPSESNSIRVSVEKVDQLINLVGELVITQAMLAQTVSKIDPVLHETLVQGMALLERSTRDLQESVMSIRMMPIGFVFSRFPRVVRDLAGKLGKEVELKTVGEGTELDKGLIEKIADPLTHLVRNSIDHGIETPQKRIAAGKPAKGTITLRAYHQGGNIAIEVSDDGAGLNRQGILDKARQRGLSISETISDQEVWQLIFEAGFSTAEVVTDVSGRGVGMDVVRRNIQALGGSIEIESALGVGTRMSIRLPLTLAILDGLSVAVGQQTFIIPLTYIVESLQPKTEDIKTIRNSGMVIHVRGEYLPIQRAHDVFGIPSRNTDMTTGIVVILESDGEKKALFVDELLGQHQVVIKSLETHYKKVRGVSGATIMGDGHVALILDVGALVRERRVEMKVAA